MAHLPALVADSPLSQELISAGLRRIHQGKVRDTYEIPGYPEYLLVVATDRISVFDFVLPCLVPDKGAVLTGLTVFWLTRVLGAYPNHYLASGSDIYAFLPKALPKNRDLLKRSVVVQRQNMRHAELIVRGFLTGSGWESYQKNGMVCGIKLPQGLHDGSKLPEPIFTPTTKADDGHDEHLTWDQFVEVIGNLKEARRLRDSSLQYYMEAAAYASNGGIIVADTKFEFGDVLADEVLTPDSSRFWFYPDWEESQKKHKSPAGYDKQPVRDFCKTIQTPFAVTGIHKLDPRNPDHLAFVDTVQLPNEVIDQCTDRYRKACQLITGRLLDN